MTHQRIFWLTAFVVQAAAFSVAHAQVIDDIEIRREGGNAVVQFHFIGSVQLIRSVNVRSGDLVQIYYNYLTNNDTAALAKTERLIRGVPGLPPFTLLDEPDSRSSNSRRLMLRFPQAVRQQVRMGRDRQSIELILDDLGKSVTAAVAAPTQATLPGNERNAPPLGASNPTSAVITATVLAGANPVTTAAAASVALPSPIPRPATPLVPPVDRVTAIASSSNLANANFTVNLQRSTQTSQSLNASIPSEFQNQPVFTSQRVVNDATLYEINLGYFSSLAEADKARLRLLRRFPQAEVQSLGPTAIASSSANPAAVSSTRPSTGTPPATSLSIATGNAAVTTAQSVTSAGRSASVPVTATPSIATATSPSQVVPQSLAGAAEYNAKAKELMAFVDAALARQDTESAIDGLNEILNLPNNTTTRHAQEMIGQLRLQTGDVARARAEFEHFLAIYPKGVDSDRVRLSLKQLPTVEIAQAPAPIQVTSSTSGSISMFYFGGQSQVRSLDFQNSPISGLPVLQNENLLSGNDFKQLQTNMDLNWRYRDSDMDQRFVLRDSATADLMPDGSKRNRLTALYYEQRSFVNGTNFRIGRQSPTGGGVMYRYDGVQAGYTFAPNWRVNAVLGKPSDDLLDTKRTFYGAWLEAEGLTKELSGNLYVNQGMIDGVVDRQAVGTELRYFSNGVSVFSQLDYDTVLQGLNIASLQGNWITEGGSSINFMADRRSTPFRSLSNILFFQDPNATQLARRVQDLLQTSNLETLRAQVNSITAMQTQGLLGFTTPLSANWQAGANLTYTNIGAIAPVAVILPSGQESTGDLWSGSAQLIGSNLYSARDTHIFSLSQLAGPTYHGTMLSYNNFSGLNESWQLEPSLRYYLQQDNDGTRTDRITPGFRITYHIQKQLSLETETTVEISKIEGPTRFETARRMFYYFGGRYDF
jgi:hypothetical protein